MYYFCYLNCRMVYSYRSSFEIQLGLLLRARFMGAIEEITSATRTIYREAEGAKRKIEVKVWNDTLANLSLMALGSSAPEILLSLLELLGRRSPPH